MNILLASSSPRRQDLLGQIGLPFRIEVPAVDEDALLVEAGRAETPPTLEDAAALACRIADLKAGDVIRRRVPCGERHVEVASDTRHGEASADGRDVVVAADTIVVCDGRLLAKPSDAAEARAMLTSLSGRAHHVVTGLCTRVAGGDEPAEGRGRTQAEITEVTFRALSDALIDAYVASGEPYDKAGGYGIQGLGAALVKRIDGCYFNVVGLPLGLLSEMLASLGFPVHGWWGSAS